jgi:triosephosphate isomerase (TIM)
VVANLNEGHEVLVCIGETRLERESNQTEIVLKTQLTPLLSDKTCTEHFSGRLHIAYEPVWAIGTGLTASPAQAEEAHTFIRGMLKSALDVEKAKNTKILYGGSVTPANFKELIAQPNIDGGLVGGASLKLESWLALWDIV